MSDDCKDCPERSVTVPITRRTWFNVALMGVGAALVGVPVVGYLVGPLLRDVRQRWRTVGAVDSFAVGTTVKVEFENPSPGRWSGLTARTAAWLRRESKDEFVAFAINCTHLGCPVRWLQKAELFMCPCHGGVYYASGKVAAGPPPQPLPRYPVRVRRGKVEIRTSALPITTT